MAVQESVYFPLPEELKAALIEEFSEAPELLRLIEGEAPILGQKLLETYQRINRTFSAREIIVIRDHPNSNGIVSQAERIRRVERLLRRWLSWADRKFETPELFKRQFAELFPLATTDWQAWLDQEHDMVRAQLLIARDDLIAGRDILGHSHQESVELRNQAISLIGILIEDWDRVLSLNLRHWEQSQAISQELGLD